MALKIKDMYWRMYADSKLHVFTITSVPLSEPTHQELVASEATLKSIAKLLQDDGWVKCQRRAFELHVRKGLSSL